MLKVGVTGGIGSGKSTVCKIFEVLGVPVYYADLRAKEIIHSDKEIKKEIISLLGDVFLPGGELDRKKVAGIVFSFPELLEKYNAIIHPAVLEDMSKWMRRHQQSDYAIVEAALLIESAAHEDLDYVICVSAPEQVRVERIMKRDNATETEVRARIANQMNESEKQKLCDFVIYNAGDSPLIPQVIKINEKLIQLTGKEYQV